MYCSFEKRRSKSKAQKLSLEMLREMLRGAHFEARVSDANTAVPGKTGSGGEDAPELPKLSARTLPGPSKSGNGPG